MPPGQLQGVGLGAAASGERHKPVCPVCKGAQGLHSIRADVRLDPKDRPFALPGGSCLRYGNSGRKLSPSRRTHSFDLGMET